MDCGDYSNFQVLAAKRREEKLFWRWILSKSGWRCILEAAQLKWPNIWTQIVVSFSPPLPLLPPKSNHQSWIKCFNFTKLFSIFRYFRLWIFEKCVAGFVSLKLIIGSFRPVLELFKLPAKVLIYAGHPGLWLGSFETNPHDDCDRRWWICKESSPSDIYLS